MAIEKHGLPNTEEENALIERIRRFLRKDTDKDTKQALLLDHLVTSHRDPKNSDASGDEIVQAFYNKHRQDGETTEDDETRRKLVGALRSAVFRYYGTLYCSDTFEPIILRIGDRYKPVFSFATPREAVSVRPGTVLEHLGDNNNALARLNSLLPTATLIEDVSIRWEEGTFYPYEKRIRRSGSGGNSGLSPIEHFGAELRKAYQANPNITYRSVTGPIVDTEQVKQVEQAFRGRERSYQFELFKMRHTVPLLNFTILYTNEEPQRKVVLFGYGRQQSEEKNKPTAVFFSDNPELVREFRDLFEVMQDERFSRQIDLDDPSFLASRPSVSDVIATFEKFPADEIVRDINALRPPGRIDICSTTWPQLDTEENLGAAIQNALFRGCDVSVALWESDSAFFALRGHAIKGDRDHLQQQMIQTKKELTRIDHALKREAEERKKKGEQDKAIGQLTIDRCKAALGSVVMCRVGELIYFGPYWVGANAARGPHFLVPKATPTGRFLFSENREIGQFQKMVNGVPFADRPKYAFLHEPDAAASGSGATILDRWDAGRLAEFIKSTAPAKDADPHSKYGDLRIMNTFFINSHGFRHDFETLLEEGVQIKLLILNPDNAALVKARFGNRTDYPPSEARKLLRKQAREFSKLGDGKKWSGSIQVRYSNLMPYGFAAYNARGGVIGLLPTHETYLKGPMIQTEAGSKLWTMMDDDWKARWEASHPIRFQ